MLKKTLFAFYFSLLVYHFSLAQTWAPVGGGIVAADSMHPAVNVFCVYNNKLYVGGYFISAGKLQANSIVSWDGKKWDTLGAGIREATKEYPDFYSHVDAMCVYKNMLCVGGLYEKAGNFTSRFRGGGSNIALWVDTIHPNREWKPIPGGVSWMEVYEGTAMDSKDYSHVCVRALCTYKDELYIGGVFSSVGGGNAFELSGAIAKWDLKNGWSGLDSKKHGAKNNKVVRSSLQEDIISFVNSMEVFSNNLYIGNDGNCPQQPIYCDAKITTWDDTTLHAVWASGMKLMTDTRCFGTYDSELYVGGYYNKDPLQTCGLEKWDGSKWVVIGQGAWKGKGIVNSMVEYHGKLYIGGRFDSLAGKAVHNIAVWDGKTLEPVGDGFLASKKKLSVVNALCVYKDELYVAGDFSYSGDKPLMNIAKLNLKNENSINMGR